MDRARSVGIGIIGAGNISDRYLSNLMSYPLLDIRFVADLIPSRARDKAVQYGIPHWGTTDDLLRDEGIQIVVNLTLPSAHVDIALQCINAGKHVWSEKPFAVNRAQGQSLLDAAHSAGFRVATAPDTVLGTGIQTARRLLESGRIGTAIAASTALQTPGPESWHPSPEFLFQSAAGPLFDMGPYYVSALVQFFGPASRVSATARTFRDVRTIGSGPRAGTSFKVEVPTFLTATIEFAAGQVAQSILTFDSVIPRAQFEIYGDEGAIVVPDPDNFGGQIVVYDSKGHSEVIDTGPVSNGRGLGVVELAEAILDQRAERASGEQAFHVLDILESIAEAAERHQPVEVGSSFTLAPVLPDGWNPRCLS